MISIFIFYLIIQKSYHVFGAQDIVKLLQINDDRMDNCSRHPKICKEYMSSLYRLLRVSKPNIILYISKMKINKNPRIIHLKNKKMATILPIVGDNNNNKCLNNLSFKINNCYYVKDVMGISFIILNSNSWLSNSNQKYANIQTDWLKRQLHNLYKKKKNVIVVGYKSPKLPKLSNDQFDYNSKIIDLFLEFSSIIKGYIFNGENFDSIKIFFNKKNVPSTIMFTPIPISTLDNSVPLARAFIYNKTTNEITSYINYSLKDSFWHSQNILSSISLDNNFIRSSSIGSMSKDSASSQTQENIMNIENWKQLASSILKNTSRKLLSSRKQQMEMYCQPSKTNLLTNCNNKCEKSSDHSTIDSKKCVIIVISKAEIEICLRNCKINNIFGMNNINVSHSHSIENNGALFVMVVIVVFILVLLGIVLAVNKVYCMHKNRSRSIFLAPLTLEVQIDNDLSKDEEDKTEKNESVENKIVDNNIKNKITDSPQKKDSIGELKSQKKTNVNGFKRTNSNDEKSYNYVRM